MAHWIKTATKGRRWREITARLSWMAIVGLLIYGVQHLPISAEWKIAVGDAIGIFGGVELILDVLRGRGIEREYEQLRQEYAESRREADAEKRQNEELRREADAEKRQNEELRREAYIERRENEELRRRNAELEAIIRAAQERENEELRRRNAELEAIIRAANQPGNPDA